MQTRQVGYAKQATTWRQAASPEKPDWGNPASRSTIIPARRYVQSMIQKKFLALCLMLSALSAQADESVQTDCRMRGMYTNDVYGFSVIIPLDHVACPNSPLGMQEHGLVVELSDDWIRNIEAYAGYNSRDYVDLQDVAEGAKDILDDDLPRDSIKELSRNSTHLGGLPATRIVMRFPGGDNSGPMIQDEVSALRKVIPGTNVPSHFYSLRLVTQEAHYVEDRRIFEKMLASWRELPTDDDAQPAAPGASTSRPVAPRKPLPH